MAKDLHWFKFICSEWEYGDVILCSMAAQGLFTNLMSFYWSCECMVPEAKARKRYPNYQAEIDELLSNDIMRIEDGFLRISFLDEQKAEVQRLAPIKAKNGALGGRGNKRNKASAKPTESQDKAKLKLNESEPKANVKLNESKTKVIREDKIFSREQAGERLILSHGNGQPTTAQPLQGLASGVSLNPKTKKIKADFLDDIEPYKFQHEQKSDILKMLDVIPDENLLPLYAKFRREYKTDDNKHKKPGIDELIDLLYLFVPEL